MYIRHVGNETGERVPFVENGTEITFGEGENTYTVDAAALQQDTQVIFDVRQEDDGTLGITGHWYAATLTIPPKKYELVEGDVVTVNEDGTEERSLDQVAIPLDMGAVEVALYPLGRPLEAPVEGSTMVEGFDENSEAAEGEKED